MMRDLKTSQSIKIRAIADALCATGYVTLDQQAAILGVCRSTMWVVRCASHKASGLSARTINRMLSAPDLPSPVREKILEYVKDKVAGRYGHTMQQRRTFAAHCSNIQPKELTQ
jgi:hypothetical protein